MNFTILRYESIDSTNPEAAKHAKLGAAEGLCILARRQTAGRGRHGRVWISERDSGLYFSLVLRPKIEPRFLPLITLMTGVAVYDTLLEFGLEPDIKWVNDIHVNGKKISGILAETVDTNDGLAVVLGVGVNLNSASFPSEISAVATSIEEETGQVVTGEELAKHLTRFVAHFYAILNRVNGNSEIIDEWRRRSTYFSGKNVRVVMENETVVGTTDGLEDNGALRVKSANGNVAIIQSGDVERLRTTD